MHYDLKRDVISNFINWNIDYLRVFIAQSGTRNIQAMLGFINKRGFYNWKVI